MATTRNQLSYGSQGNEVTELQKLLNQNGYKLSEDGIFGDATQSAVKDYQQKNSLSADGIVGTNTWGVLTGVSTAQKNTGTTAATPAADTGFKYDAYQESDAVKQAQAMLQQQMSQKPGEYQSAWQAQLNAAIDKIMNREKFSYDLNGDALYNQYKDQYINQGKMAMMDTMGQASAMTGGYGNSYAQSVGQQAYQGHLQQLNDKIPELYQLALNKYQMEGDEMLDQYAMLSAQEQQDYGRHRDTVSDYNTELDRLENRYDTERNYDYSQWADNRDFSYGQYSDDRAYEYQQGRDKVADEQWQKEFDEALRQFNFANKLGEFAPKAVVSTPTSTPKKENPNPQPQPVDDGFTGNTYSEAVAYMKSQGVDSAAAAGIMTQSEFNRKKASGSSSADVTLNSTYKDYLQTIVEYKTQNK